MEVGVGTPNGSQNVGIGLRGTQNDPCTCSKWQLTSSSVPHTLVIGTCCPIRPSGPNGTNGPKELIKVHKLG